MVSSDPRQFRKVGGAIFIVATLVMFYIKIAMLMYQDYLDAGWCLGFAIQVVGALAGFFFCTIGVYEFIAQDPDIKRVLHKLLH